MQADRASRPKIAITHSDLDAKLLRNGSKLTATPPGTIGGVVLTAFLVGLGLVLVALAACVLRGLSLWSQMKASGRAFSEEVAKFEERSARTEQLLAEAETSSKELQAAVERLRVSRARLQILLDEIERAKARTRWLRAYLPV
jgi:uncharacterized protein YhaN